METPQELYGTEKKNRKFTPEYTETSGQMHEIVILKTVYSTQLIPHYESGDESLAKMAVKLGRQNYSLAETAPSDETLPIINNPKHLKKGKNKEQNGRTHIQEDKRTT